MAVAGSNALRVVRGIAAELRKVSTIPLKDHDGFRYIMNQYRKHTITDKQLCKAHEEMNFIAATYLCYMRSTRLQKEINKEFSGKGERTVKETANMVGFKLPHDPK